VGTAVTTTTGTGATGAFVTTTGAFVTTTGAGVALATTTGACSAQ
jgi:hypothetical protein